MSYGERLREERLRLKLAQPMFAEACGVSRGSQFNYEKEENSPGIDYWMNADKLGVDVAYVITGRRSQGFQGVSENTATYNSPSPREGALLARWRRLDERMKRALEHLLEATEKTLERK